jgi:hypothetical protein
MIIRSIGAPRLWSADTKKAIVMCSPACFPKLFAWRLPRAKDRQCAGDSIYCCRTGSIGHIRVHYTRKTGPTALSPRWNLVWCRDKAIVKERRRRRFNSMFIGQTNKWVAAANAIPDSRTIPSAECRKIQGTRYKVHGLKHPQGCQHGTCRYILKEKWEMQKEKNYHIRNSALTYQRSQWVRSDRMPIQLG